MSEDKHSEDEYKEEAEYSEDEYQDESEDVEGSDGNDGTEDAESGEDDMSDWGYAQKKKRFSKEVVLGFGAIALLAGAFFWFSQYPADDGGPDESELAGGPPASDLGDPTDPFSDVPGGNAGEVLPGLEDDGDPSISSDDSQFEPPLLDAEAGTLLDSDSAVADSGNMSTSDPRRDVFGARSDFGSGNDRSDGDLIDSSESTFAQGNSTNEFSSGDRAEELPSGLLEGDLDTGSSGLTDIDSSTEFSSRPFGSDPVSSGPFDSSESSASPEIDFGGDSSRSGTEFRSEPSDLSTSATLPDLDDSSTNDRPGGLLDEPRDGSLSGNEFGSSSNSLPDDNSFESQPSGNVELMQPEPLSDDTGLNSDFSSNDSALPLDAGNTGLSNGNALPNGTAFPDSLPDRDSFGSSNSFNTETSQGQPFSSDNTSSDQDGAFNESSRDSDPGLNNEFRQPTTGRETRSFSENTFETSASSSTQFGAGPGSGRYTIQSGDSYWSISKKVYGTPRHFQRLANLNRSVIPNPNRMKPGVVIHVPDPSVFGAASSAVARSGNDSPSAFTGQIQPVESADSVVSESSSGLFSGRTSSTDPGTSGLFHNSQGYPMYRVGRGDNLTMIAAQHLGRASRWKQIYHMNRDRLKSPDNLREGLDLKLPADASKVPLVDRTSSLR